VILRKAEGGVHIGLKQKNSHHPFINAIHTLISSLF